MARTVCRLMARMYCVAVVLLLLGGCTSASVDSESTLALSGGDTSGLVGEDSPWRQVSSKVESEVIGAGTVGMRTFQYRDEGSNRVVEWAWHTDEGEIYRHGSTVYDSDGYVLEQSFVNKGVSASRDAFFYDDRGSCIRHIEEHGDTLDSLDTKKDVVYQYDYDDEAGIKTIFEYVDGKLEGTSTLSIDADDPAGVDGAGKRSVDGVTQPASNLPAFDGDPVTGDGVYRVMDDEGREMQELSISNGDVRNNNLNIYDDEGILLVELHWWISSAEEAPHLDILSHDYENTSTGEMKSGHEYYLKRYAPDAQGQQPTMEMVLVHPQEILRKESGSESDVSFAKVQVIDDPVSYGLVYDPSVFGLPDKSIIE